MNQVHLRKLKKALAGLTGGKGSVESLELKKLQEALVAMGQERHEAKLVNGGVGR